MDQYAQCVLSFPAGGRQTAHAPWTERQRWERPAEGAGALGRSLPGGATLAGKELRAEVGGKAGSALGSGQWAWLGRGRGEAVPEGSGSGSRGPAAGAVVRLLCEAAAV